MNKNILMSLCAAGIVALSGCTTVAEMAGADTATLNASAAQNYTKMVADARSKNQLDMSSSTYKRVNNVFMRLKPYADQMNQTGQAFQWQLAVMKSSELNAFVAPGGKVVVYTGIVERLNLTDAEIAGIMGHEMVHALEEHSKQKIEPFRGAQDFLGPIKCHEPSGE